MTVMPPGQLAPDSLLSYARLDGDAVRVVLALSDDASLTGPQVFVRFQNRDGGFRVPAALEQAAGRSTVRVSVPRDQLADGVWRLKLRESKGAPLHDLGARVLLHADQPVALLFGKTPNID